MGRGGAHNSIGMLALDTIAESNFFTFLFFAFRMHIWYSRRGGVWLFQGLLLARSFFHVSN